MGVPTTLRGISATAGSNSPAGTDVIGSNADDYLRGIQAVLRQYLASVGSNIASASTTDLSTADGFWVTITGTTTITSLGTESAGIWYGLIFNGALTFTHNATSLILPGGANITTAAGDSCFAESLGSGNWKIHAYQKASGNPVLISGFVAAQSDQETATSTTTYVSPGRQQFHPSACKGWVEADYAGNAAASYNVSSVTDSGTGHMVVNWSTDMSSANYAAVASGKFTPGGSAATTLITMVASTNYAAGTTQIFTILASTFQSADGDNICCAVFGDQ